MTVTFLPLFTIDYSLQSRPHKATTKVNEQFRAVFISFCWVFMQATAVAAASQKSDAPQHSSGMYRVAQNKIPPDNMQYLCNQWSDF